ncbi:MAG: metallophosphoesterase family protein [Candidatus Omnitrophica bacterium]|nr:metallophosphoesterase family protein [Candidatus Omnitrophota bacterium]
MRYAIISDIHSNLEALEAVAEALSKEHIDKYLCLGDVVGYGADPKPCIRLLRSLSPEVTIAGNHDWAVAGLTDIAYFNEAARDAVEWTRGAIGGDERDFLKALLPVYETKRFTLVHGTLEDPAEFRYILNGYDALKTIKLSATGVCFVGHSHVAETFYTDGEHIAHTTMPEVRMESGRKYVVNAGSVGQPRDGDPRAAFVIYDDEEGTVYTRRVPYDIKTARDKIMKAGLPPWLAARLSKGM